MFTSIRATKAPCSECRLAFAEPPSPACDVSCGPTGAQGLVRDFYKSLIPNPTWTSPSI